MEQFQMLRSFIENSDFMPEIKSALLETIVLAYEGKPISAYATLVKNLAERGPIED
jgi:hypothetical protein